MQTENASDLLKLPENKRRHCMEALVYFSKYLGAYHIWKQIKERHALKWSVQNDVAIFESITNDDNNYDAMLKWLRLARSKIPKEYGDVLVYGVLTGLRATEVCHSVNLLASDSEKYYDKTRGLLTHYKYPETFIRNTKKAYISIVTPEILKIAKRHDKPVTYEMLRKALEREGLEMHMGYTRKIFGTYLKTQKVPDETIDLLQGRLPKSVFLRFYNRPNFKDEIENVRRHIIILFGEI